MEPLPLSVHDIAPLDALAPLTVAVPFEHIVWLPPADAVGVKFTVIVASPSVKPDVRGQPAALETLTNVYERVLVGLVVTLNGIPDDTLVAVRLAVPSLYTT